MRNLPRDWVLIKSVLRKHLMLALLLFGMGIVFSIVGGGVMSAGGMVIFGAVFLISGLAIILFGLYSTYSSCCYYYEQALVTKQGEQIQAIVTDKLIQRALDRNGTTNPNDEVIETDLLVQYDYEWLRKSYKSESFINDLDPFEPIQIETPIPILVIPSHPTIKRL